MRSRVREEALKRKPAVQTPDVQASSSLTSDAANVGNAASSAPAGHRFESMSVQGITISHPTDAAEREASRVAETVAARNPESAKSSSSHVNITAPSLSASVATPAERSGAPSGIESLAKHALSQRGEPLPDSARRAMDPVFGQDFSDVRIHTGGAAADSARSINASAYTVGRNVVFGAGKFAPGTSVGDRLLAHELTHVVQNGGAQSGNEVLALSRDVEVPPAPLTFNAPAEREKDAFAESDKERARLMVIAPLRAAAAQLGGGVKADVPSVIRHLRIMRVASAGVKWPESVRDEIASILDDITLERTVLESLKMSDRQAIAAARAHWTTAKRELAAARKAIKDSQPDPSKNPDATPREGASEDTSAVIALSAQVDATIQDLVRAPRTQEGFQGVGAIAEGVFAQFDTVAPPEAVNDVARAKESFGLGLANIAPLALGKEQTIKQIQDALQRHADRLAEIVGDAPPAADTGEPGKDDEENNPPHDPAPSPNPLPPPPPPPPDSNKK
jgi:hypothetical protein